MEIVSSVICLSGALMGARHSRTNAVIVCPLIRSVGLKAAPASSRVATLPMFVPGGRVQAGVIDFICSRAFVRLSRLGSHQGDEVAPRVVTAQT
ncbi:hypothetical protein [Microbispora sp. H10836]|uniref:hypothetical protein n=1 Tax=Microbispora sp. H10836 TaxID=2729106 RepID=UPI0014739C35|nr:hypothetical protein [Microbispora sp. H10836]